MSVLKIMNISCQHVPLFVSHQSCTRFVERKYLSSVAACYSSSPTLNCFPAALSIGRTPALWSVLNGNPLHRQKALQSIFGGGFHVPRKSHSIVNFDRARLSMTKVKVSPGLLTFYSETLIMRISSHFWQNILSDTASSITLCSPTSWLFFR